MKPPKFDYFAPSSLAEALSLLSEYGSEARVLAGGQSLMPALNFRLARPSVLIDINRVPGIDGINSDNGTLRIGGMARQRDIEMSSTVAKTMPLLSEATRLIAHLPIRTRGTIGGSLANADPAAEDPAVAVALEAVLVCQSVRGERRIDAASFFIDIMATALEPDEILTSIEFPVTGGISGSAFTEIARRDGDFALAGIAAKILLTDGIVADARISGCGIGPASKRMAAAEAILIGTKVDDLAVTAACQAVMEAADPHGDVHASADYRCRLAGVMAHRAITTAVERALGHQR